MSFLWAFSPKIYQSNFYEQKGENPIEIYKQVNTKLFKCQRREWKYSWDNKFRVDEYVYNARISAFLQEAKSATEEKAFIL